MMWLLIFPTGDFAQFCPEIQCPDQGGVRPSRKYVIQATKSWHRLDLNSELIKD